MCNFGNGKLGRVMVVAAVVCSAGVFAADAPPAPTPPEKCNCKEDIGVAVIRAVGVVARAQTDVSATSNIFTNNSITITAGDTVKWTINQGFHTVTDDNGAFDSGGLAQGSTFSHTYATAGIFPYHCIFHVGSGMIGTVIVQAAAAPPVISSPLTANAVLNANFSYTLTASGNPAPTVSFVNPPVNLTVNGATISGAFDTVGTYSIGLHATNSGGSVDKTLVVTVGTAPSITSALNATTLLNTSFSYQLTANGSPAPTLTFTTVPSALQVNGDTISGTFTDAGTFSIGIHASNAFGTVDKTLLLASGTFPTITSPLAAGAVVGQSFSYQLQTSGTPPSLLSFTNVPSDLIQNGDTISGTFTTAGTFSVGLHSLSQFGADDQTLVITAGTQPDITSDLAAKVLVGQNFSYQLTATGTPPPVVSFSDVPAGLQVNGDTISGTFDAAAAGTYTIGLTASNGVGTNVEFLTLIVGTVPVITTSIAADATSNSTFSYTIQATGSPTPDLTFNNVPQGFQVNGATITGTFTSVGQFGIGIHATNVFGSDNEALVVTVTNKAKITSDLTAQVLNGDTFSYTLTASGDPVPDVSFTNLPAGLTTAGATISGAVTTSGVYSIGLHASNTDGTDDEVLTLTVGTPASISTPLTAQAVVGSDFSLTLQANGFPAPALSFSEVPLELKVDGDTISGTFSTPGPVTIGVHATNQFGTDDHILIITAGTVPIITSPKMATAIIGSTFNYTLAASGSPIPDLTFTNVPDGLAGDGSLLSGTVAAAGVVTVGIHASNLFGVDDQTLTITAGTVPVITSMKNVSAKVGLNFSYTLAATGNPAPDLSFTNVPDGFEVSGTTLSGIFDAEGAVTVGIHAENAVGSARRRAEHHCRNASNDHQRHDAERGGWRGFFIHDYRDGNAGDHVWQRHIADGADADRRDDQRTACGGRDRDIFG